MQLQLPRSDLECSTQLLLTQLEDLEPIESEPEGGEPGAGT
jgi:hypothetical protein